jgi:hypothetical protein
LFTQRVGVVVAVSDREVPFDDKVGIYATMVGQPYYVQPRDWWNHFWRVTMLARETVPTRITEAIDSESAQIGERQDDRFQIYDSSLPECSRDTVTLELQRSCKKETLVVFSGENVLTLSEHGSRCEWSLANKS